MRPFGFAFLPRWLRAAWWRARSGMWSAGKEHRNLEQLARQQAVERERTRIAQDIHDDLGANLTLIAGSAICAAGKNR